MGVPVSLLSCRWFDDDEIDHWLRQDSKPKIFGRHDNQSYVDYAQKQLVRSSPIREEEKHKGRIICFEKVAGGRMSRTHFVDRIDDGLLMTNSTKTLFARAFLKVSPKFYPLGVHKHQKYGKCMIAAPAKIMTIYVLLDGVPQRLCRQYGHAEHIPDSFFSWSVTNENAQTVIDIPLWSPGDVSSTPDILRLAGKSTPTRIMQTPTSTPRGTPNGRSSRKGRWASHLSHGSACAKAFHDFIRSLPCGNHELSIDVGFMYNLDEIMLLPLEKSQVGDGGHVWKNGVYSSGELASVDMTKTSTLVAFPMMLASGSIKVHKSSDKDML